MPAFSMPELRNLRAIQSMRIERFSERPLVFLDARPERRCREAGCFSPLRERHRAAAVCNTTIAAVISHLSFSAGPSHIAVRVIATVVDSIYFELTWAWPYMCKKIFEGIKQHFDAARSVGFKAGIVRIATARTQILPRDVFARPMHAMLSHKEIISCQ